MLKPLKYVKKPVVIDAMQLSEDNIHTVGQWCGGEVTEEVSPRDHSDIYMYVTIPTLEGQMKAELGDWVIKGVKGEFYPCKPDIFDATYDREVPFCARCSRARTDGKGDHPSDAYDYDIMDYALHDRVGWYSGSDGEICADCLRKLMRQQ